MAKFQIQITGDPTDALAATKQVDTAFGKLRTSAQTTSKSMATSFGVPEAKLKALGVTTAAVGAGMTLALTRPLINFATESVRVFQAFEGSMNRVRAVTTETGATFEDLEAKAKRLGSTTQFTATQAGDAMAFLGQAGFTTDQVLGSIEGTLNLAAAGSLELANAADIASNVVSGFGLATTDAAQQTANMNRVVDVMAATAANSNTNIEQLGQALSFVAPVAQQLGISIEETSAFIGKLSDAGIQATRAGTGLRRILSVLVDPTKEAAKALNRMGVETRDSAGEFRGLEDILGQIVKSGAGAQEFFQIFGVQGASVAGVLAQQLGPGLDDLKNKLIESEGAAEKMAEEINSGLPGALIKMESAIDGAKNALGETLAPAIELVAGSITDVSSAFANLPQPVIAIITVLGGLLAVLGPVIAAVGLWITTVAAMAAPAGAVTGLVGVLGAGLAALTGPIGLVIAGIAAAIAIFLAFRVELTEAAVGVVAYAAELINAIPHIETIKKAISAFGQIILLVGELAITPFIEILKFLGVVGTFVFDIFRNKGKEAMEAQAKAAEEAAKANEKLSGTTEELAAEDSELVKQLKALEEEYEKNKKDVKDVGTETGKTAKKVKEFKFEVRDLTAEIIKGERETKKLAQAIKILATQDLKAAIAATEDLKTRTDAVVNSFPPVATAGQEMADQVAAAINESLLPALDEIPTRTQDVEDAFKRLGVKGVKELNTLADQAQKDFELIRNSGIASSDQLLEAEKNNIEARVAASAAAGQMISEADKKRLAEIEAAQKDHQVETTNLFTEWADGISSITNSLSADLVRGLFSGEFNTKSIGEKLRSIASSFKDSFFEPVTKLISGFVNGGLKTLISGLSGLASGKGFGGFGALASNIAGALGGGGGGGLGGAIGGLFGIGGGGAAAGATAATGTAGAAGGFLGGLGPAAVGLATNPIGLAVLGGIAAAAVGKTLFSKSSIEKFGKEFERDFGGVSLPKDFTKGLLNQLDISKKQLEPIRKDIASAPITLVAALEKARQQGKEEAFLTSLESVGNIFGEGNLRGGLELGLLTGDFTALNDEFTRLFEQSTTLTATFGQDLQPLLIDMAANGVTPLTEKIRELQDAGTSQTDIFRELGAEITLQTLAAEELGVTLDPLITQYGDMVGETKDLTDSQIGLLFAFQELEAAPANLAAAMQQLVLDMEFLESRGASTEQIMMLMGESLQAAADAALEMGVEIPPAIAELVDLGEVAEEVTDDVEELTEAVDAFTAGMEQFESSFAGAFDDAAGLAGQFTAAFERMSANGIDATTAMDRSFELFSRQILNTFNDLVLFGEEIPPQLQNIVNLLLEAEKIEIDDQGFIKLKEAAEDAAEAIDKVDSAGGAAGTGRGRGRGTVGRSRGRALRDTPVELDERQLAALKGLQERVDRLAESGRLQGDDPLARQLRGGLSLADVQSIQAGRLPGARGNTARFGEFEEDIVSAAEVTDDAGDDIVKAANDMGDALGQASSALDLNKVATEDLTEAHKLAAQAAAEQARVDNALEESTITATDGVADLNDAVGGLASTARNSAEAIRDAFEDLTTAREASRARGRGDGGGRTDVQFRPTVNVSMEGQTNPEEIARVVDRQMEAQGDRFIRRRLVPAIQTTLQNNTGGARTSTSRVRGRG